VSFDLFDFSVGVKKGYKNIKTFGDICQFSNGNLYYYPDFSSRSHGTKFSNELYHNITRPAAWESVFRIRLSAGWNQITNHGNTHLKPKT
jgi:protein transport protein SEC24